MGFRFLQSFGFFLGSSFRGEVGTRHVDGFMQNWGDLSQKSVI